MTTNTNDRSGKVSPCAAIVSKYAGPTNRLGSRIIVNSQHALGRKAFPWNYELDVGGNHAAAVGLYLERLEKIAKGAYGPDAKGWGGIEDYAHGVTPDGLHVFCSK